MTSGGFQLRSRTLGPLPLINAFITRLRVDHLLADAVVDDPRSRLGSSGCFHATRHTAATLMLAAGVNPPVARERLGHATVSITLDRYSHVTHAAHRQAALSVEGLLRAASTDRVSTRVSEPPERDR
jgi:integrase